MTIGNLPEICFLKSNRTSPATEERVPLEERAAWGSLPYPLSDPAIKPRMKYRPRAT